MSSFRCGADRAARADRRAQAASDNRSSLSSFATIAVAIATETRHMGRRQVDIVRRVDASRYGTRKDLLGVRIFHFRAGSVTAHVGHLVRRVRAANESRLSGNRHTVRVIALSRSVARCQRRSGRGAVVSAGSIGGVSRSRRGRAGPRERLRLGPDTASAVRLRIAGRRAACAAGGSSISHEVKAKKRRSARESENFIGGYDECASVLIQCPSG